MVNVFPCFFLFLFSSEPTIALWHRTIESSLEYLEHERHNTHKSTRNFPVIFLYQINIHFKFTINRRIFPIFYFPKFLNVFFVSEFIADVAFSRIETENSKRRKNFYFFFLLEIEK